MAELRGGASKIGRLGLSSRFAYLWQIYGPALGILAAWSRLYILIAELRVSYVCRLGLSSRRARLRILMAEPRGVLRM
jgi:hypothetical protein